MRLLIGSLFAAIFCTLIGAGWFLSQLYKSQAPTDELPEELLLKELGRNIAELLADEHISFNEISPSIDAEMLPLEEFPLPEELLQSLYLGEVLTLEGESGRRLYFLVESKQALLSIAVPLSAPSSSSALIYTLIFYATVLVAVGLWLWPLLSRLLRLRKVALRFGQGELDARVKGTKWSYIADIESAFNAMANDIERLLNDNKTLSRAISHELRTPLARLRLGVDVLGEAVEAKHDQYVERIDRDLDEMQSLIDALLHYSKLDKTRIPLDIQSHSLSDLMQKQLESYSWYEGDITCKIDNTITAKTDAYYFGLIFSNTVANAFKYGSGKVAVSLRKEHGKPVISIEDNGVGIAESERAAIFDLFHRHKHHSDHNSASGHGIGLAVVAKTCEWLDIKITVETSSSLGGAQFLLCFNRV